MVDADQPRHEEPDSSGDGMNTPLSDAPLLDLLDALVEQRGRVAAAEALGVNYRTVAACHESRHVSRRMRKALEEYRDAHIDGSDEQNHEAGDIAEKLAALEQRVEGLEEAHSALVETVQAQARQLTELERNVGGSEVEAEQEKWERSKPDVVDNGDDRLQQWQPPRRHHGLPDAGVVTLEEQPDEGHAFGPAAELVTDWRKLRAGSEGSGGWVDRAWASVRRWELEIAMIGDYGLTLPPETEPLDASRREDHLRWRKEALAAALAKARRLRWLRRVLTLGLRWR